MGYSAVTLALGINRVLQTRIPHAYKRNLGPVCFSIWMGYLDEDESFVCLGTKSADHPDDFWKFRFNFKVRSAEPIWII